MRVLLLCFYDNHRRGAVPRLPRYFPESSDDRVCVVLCSTSFYPSPPSHRYALRYGCCYYSWVPCYRRGSPAESSSRLLHHGCALAP